ncbi:MAG: DUF4388 domain-containing protein [Vicinamibacteria bacterium]|nr:DUF4388 domain-containing protein [Vicinamibacteria bacterium]
MEKILDGSLARFEVPDLLTFLNMGRRTGVLVMENAQQETKLFLRDGNPVFATSTKEDLRMGAILVKQGRLEPGDLDRLLSRHAAGSHRLGQLLITEKVLREEELAQFLKVQVSEVIFDTFEWKDGGFALYDAVPPPASAITLEMDLQNLIMEGVRRIDERGRLKDVFRDLDMIVEAVANPERVKQSVTFTREEWQVFFLVDGRRSINEICRLVGNPDDTATLQIIHRLMAGNFVTLVASAATGEPPVQPTHVPHLPPRGEGHGTVKMLEGQAPAPPASGRSGPVSVEFSNPAGAGRKSPDDDSKGVVSSMAFRYLGEAAKVTVSRLVLVQGGDEQSYPLTRDAYTLGRHRNNDIVINDPKVSGFHARIDRTPEGFVLVDLKSRNGSFVNGRRVETGALKTGDEIRLGTARLVYKVDYTASA